MQPFTLPDLLYHNLPSRAGKTALVQGDRQVTYAELAADVECTAAKLLSLGLRKGDRVCLHMPKSIAEIVSTLAISLAGGVVVNVNASAKSRMLRHVLTHSGARFMVTAKRAASALRDETFPETLSCIVTEEGLDRELPVRSVSWTEIKSSTGALPRLVDQDNCAIIYTSGSTGLPKGVLLKHHLVTQSARAAVTHLQNSGDDRALGVLPLSFDFGLSQLTTMLLVGGTLVLPRAALAAELIRTIRDYDVNAIAMVPTMWIPTARLLAKEEVTLDAVRYVANSGGALPSDVQKAWPKLFPNARLYLMYGMTEGFRSSYLPPGDYQRKMGSIGLPLPNVELFVVDPEKGLCGPNEHGELIHRGGLISSGYYRDADATAQKIRPCEALSHLIGNEAVLYSGDTVYKDGDGYLWFVARTSSFIKCSDFRVSPTEVEDIVFSSGLVSDVVAYGVPDEDLGQVVHIAASPAERGALDCDRLLAHCKREMPAYMVPRKVNVWEGRMPLTPNGKIDRPAVIGALSSGKAA